MSSKEAVSDFKRIKTRIEQTGLTISLVGLMSMLQPLNLTLYSYGFYILAVGAAISFLGGLMPEEAGRRQVFLRVASFFTIVIVVMALSIYLAPLLL